MVHSCGRVACTGRAQLQQEAGEERFAVLGRTGRFREPDAHLSGKYKRKEQHGDADELRPTPESQAPSWEAVCQLIAKALAAHWPQGGLGGKPRYRGDPQSWISAGERR